MKPLWKIVGAGKSGGTCTLRVRASDYSEARQVAAARGVAQIRDVVLIEEPPAEQTPAGLQIVLPGAERDAGASLVRNQAARAMRPLKPQKACDVGLFDDTARDQLPLL
ncbi:hypothetical protein AC629_42705 [Bradyrhizobium sp. NAS80.1]|uniref:hypothetical protein n=1 Tax=Bradyrhizobium sp. NAS80.1 TaxID=1680159 RepID=UPI0009639FDD|nr:hypothetical protein [Bradyrhizobium sp. NAS80.1]OKO67462.1 hypothetical protein AC629_42705 [Bradyrhizobium sp. NAS80.1]